MLGAFRFHLMAKVTFVLFVGHAVHVYASLSFVIKLLDDEANHVLRVVNNNNGCLAIS